MAITDRKLWEKVQRKNRIVDIAEAAFRERGYEKTTMPAVAEAAGYHKRTLYFYFRDKEELFLAVVERALVTLKTRLEGARDAVPTGDSGVRDFARAFFDFSVETPEYLDLVMAFEAKNFIYYPPGARDHLSPAQRACHDISDAIAEMITEVIRTRIHAGVIHTDLSPRALMLILWGEIVGVMQILRMRQDHFQETFGLSREALFERFVQMLEKALTS
jgi:AcrR family transcriptional regulator